MKDKTYGRIAKFMCKDNWTKGKMAATRAGRSIGPRDPMAVKWCLVGYIDKCYRSSRDYDSVVKKLDTALDEMDIPYLDLSMFNDDRSTKFEDVKKLVRRAGV